MEQLFRALEQNDINTFKAVMNDAASLNVKNSQGLSLLHVATLNKNIEFVKLLLANNLNPDIEYENEQNLIKKKFEFNKKNLKDEFIYFLDEQGHRTALHIAAKYRLLTIAEILLSHGANPNKTDVGNATPMHWAAINGDYDFINLLIIFKGNVNAVDLANSTPLHEASRRSHKKVIDLLLKHKAKTKIIDITGCTALDLIGT